MPRSILSQREQWPDRYADNNLLQAPDTDAVNDPVDEQNDADFSDADNVPEPHHKPSVMEDAAMVQWLKQQHEQGGGGSGAPGGGGAAGAGAGGAAGGTPVSGGGGVPLIRKPDGTYTSSDPEWAKLIARESGGKNIIQSPSTKDVNSGGNEAYGLFQITPGTWAAHGGQGSVYNSTPEQQSVVAANILRSNPTGSDWGAGMAGRENAQALMKGLSTATPGTSSTAPGAVNAGTPASSTGLRPVNPEHGQGPITGPDTHGALLPDTQQFENNLMKQFPQLNTPGGYRTPDGPNEHSSGHALDVMIPDKPTQDAVRTWALQQPNVNFVLNQQKQWNPDGSSSDATVPGGNATANHWDHAHINVAGDYKPDPSVTPPATAQPSATATTLGTPSPAQQPAAQQPAAPTTLPTTLPSATTPPSPTPQDDPSTQQPPPMTLAQRRQKRASTFVGRYR